MVGPDGWTTRITEDHDVEWIPPPQLDTGQTRTNHYHQPEKLHLPPNDTWTPPTDEPVLDEPAATDDDNTTHQSGGPDPPDGKAA